MVTLPSADRELDLLTKLQFRFAFSKSATALQPIITKFLAALLLKLGSPHASVRAKAREVCVEVSGRLRNEREVQLPVRKLAEQFRDLSPRGKGLGEGVEEGKSRGEVEGLRDEVRRFGLVFLRMGLERLGPSGIEGEIEERELLGSLLVVSASSSSVAGDGQVGQEDVEKEENEPRVRVREDSMSLDTRLWIQGFYFLLKLLLTWDFPERGSKEDLELKTQLNLSQCDTRFLAKWIAKLLLCDSQAFIAAKRLSQEADANFEILSALPGITMAERQLFATWATTKRESTKNNAVFEMLITQTKVGAAKFLFSAVFTDEERFLPAVIMGADETNLGLFRVADTMFKQCTFDLESETSIRGLYTLYFGQRPVIIEEDENSDEDMEDEAHEEQQIYAMENQHTLPAKAKLQIRILNLLAKSKSATRKTDEILEMVDQQLANVTEFGLEATKLRTALFNFLNWTSRVASEADVQAIALQAVDGFRDYVTNQGWPTPGEVTGKSTSRTEMDMRGKAYENIGIWAARMIFSKDMFQPEEVDDAEMDLVKFLFTSLRCDASSPEIQVSIESALGRVLNRLAKSMNEGTTSGLRAMLMEQFNTEVGDTDTKDGYKTVRSTRFAAVRFANRCLPFADCQARWMDVLAIGAGAVGERQELAEEGTKGLDPYWWSTLNGTQARADELEFPKFNQLVEYIFRGSNGEKMIKEPQQQHRYALPYAIAFCRNNLIREALQSANIPVTIEPDWEKKSDALLATNEKSRSAVRSHLKTVGWTPLTTMIDAALVGMSLNLGQCAEFAVEICSLIPNGVVGDMLDRLSIIQPTSLSNDLAIQLQAARLLGIFASHPQCPNLDRDESVRGALTRIQGWRDAVGHEVNRVRGFVLAATFILSRQALRGTLADEDNNLPAFVKLVVDLALESRDSALRGASHISLGQLMLCLDKTAHNRLDLQPERVIEQLLKDAKKEQESAVIALGRLIRGLSARGKEDETGERALAGLYALHDIKRPELQFAIGEALSVAAAGWHSKATIAEFDVDVARPSQSVGEVMLDSMLDKIINDSRNTKPSLKKASAIWLFCLIQYVGETPSVQSRLRQCQSAFARLLSDRDDIVQETGSRGLSLVYEMGDKNLKEDLVRDLVTSFTASNAKLGGTVISETELFDAGALPTGDGSVTTYKDIVSLASEMGDPSLIYRFMNLASNNAIWTSRSAFGRFGLGNVLADSAYLAENKSFYPKLYRYRFDPNPNVQKSMNDIWNALVKDSNAVIDQNFDLIIDDLLKSLVTGKEWRVRQASCAAIAELLQGRDIDKYEKYLNEIWKKAFKVSDDIKETVRVAALSLCRTLTNLLIRNLEVGDGTSTRAQKLLDHAMPFLLQQLESGAAKEVQDNAMSTLLKVIKKSPPKALRPYAPVIVETLVKSLSSLEPEAVNYVHLNAEKYGLTAEKLDNARVSHVSSSPAIQAIERCLDGLDEESMPEVMRRLLESFKSVIGLPSKVGLSSVIVTLTVRHTLKFRPYADRFAQQLRKHLFDRNDTITNSYCLALAYIMRIATDKEMQETCRFAKKLYFASEEVGHRHVAAEIVQAISKVSNDRLMAFASAFLPFAFIGRNDIDKEVREPFQKTWQDNVGGSRAVSLYLMDILELAQHIESPKWGIKHTAASAIADLISSLESTIDGNYTSSQGAAIWSLLEKALAGKTWDGKEAVVGSFPKFVKKAQLLWESKADQIDQIAIREAKRTNPAYRPHSIAALGEIVNIRENLDLASKALRAMTGIVEELLESSDERMEVEPGEPSLNSEANRDARYVKSSEPIFPS
jgi:proteasome component ECM29